MRLTLSIKNESASSLQFLRQRAENIRKNLEIRKEIIEKNIPNYLLRWNDTFGPHLRGFWMLWQLWNCVGANLFLCSDSTSCLWCYSALILQQINQGSGVKQKHGINLPGSQSGTEFFLDMWHFDDSSAYVGSLILNTFYWFLHQGAFLCP